MSRARFNELATLLERLAPQRLDTIAASFPQLEAEVRRGPDAGEAETSRDYLEARARLASALCLEVAPRISAVADRTIERTASLASSKLVVALLAAAGGATTLASLGVGSAEVARVAAIVTSGVAIVNAGLDSLSKRYTAAESQKAVELRTAAIKLSMLRSELELAVAHKLDAAVVADAIERCNQLALELNEKKDALRIV